MKAFNSYPLSANQKAIWLEEQFYTEKPIFNIGTYVRLNGIPHISRLEKAIAAVISKNDALRMRVEQENLEPSIRFEHQVDFELQVHHFESSEAAILWMNALFQKPISVSAERLYDIRLVIVNAEESFLFFKHHHIFIDGWARALLVKKIAESYNENGNRNEESPQFSDFLAKKQPTISTVTEDFWSNQFDDFAREFLFQPKSQTGPKSSERFVKQWQLPDGMSLKSKKEQFFHQLTCLIASLAISKGKNEITVGIPLLNRHDPEALETLGYFVGLIPLRIQVESDCSFTELKEKVIETFKATRKHRTISIQEINKRIGINVANFSQAYDVVFSYEKHDHSYPFGTLKVVEAGTFSSAFEQNPLVIHVEQFLSETSLNFVLDYNLNFLNRSEVETLSERLIRTIESSLKRSELKLSELPILSEEEQQFLENVQSGVSRTIHFKTVYDAICAEAKHSPDKIVLRKKEENVTHAELISTAKRIGGALQKNGVKSGVNVGIFLPRSAEVIEAIAGVIFAGGTFVYLDPNLAEARLQHIVKNANIEILIGENELNPWNSIRTISSKSVGLWQAPEIDPQHPLYILYTSGTTGTPKGVSVSQLGILNLLEELNAEIFSRYNENEELALLSSFSFDASMQFIFSCLCLGQTLTVVPEDFRKDGRALTQFLSEKKITICDGIPTHLQAMMLRETRPPSNFRTKHFLIGGEVMHKSSVEQFFRWLKYPAVITNAYGPTECSVDATLISFDRKKLAELNEIPIGRPINNSQIFILDSRGILVPPGTQGEICIAGNGLAFGYFNAPELTKKVFKIHSKYGNLYHTGDQGFWNQKGELQYLGRQDNQVKIRGFRIELEEIENQILAIDGIVQAAVITKKIRHANQIIAFVVAKKNHTPEEVGTALKEFLPEYMIPHSIQTIKALPLTRTGKVDKKALLKFSANIETSSNENLSDTALKVQAIFDEILEIKNADFHHSFFSQGGDSLSLIFLLAEIEQKFGVEMPMQIFTHTNSIKEISLYLESQELRESSQVNFKESVEKAMYWKIPNPLPKKTISRSALVTGTTGFVGTFLTKELFEQYDTVYCLVRSNSKLYAQVKSISTMLDYEIDWEQINTKIAFIPGDLALKNLGMSDEDYQTICSNVGSIYHCGADVHFLKDFSAMSPVNISGTSELLKIACTETLKKFNLISTVGIFNDSESLITESSPIENEIHAENNGYEATKWIAEGLTMRYRELGIPASIFRLARITGHSKTGIARNDDFFHRFMFGCIDLGIFPKEMLDKDTDLTPIDIAAKGIVSLALNLPPGDYHIIHEERVTFRNLLASLKKEQINLTLVSTEKFLEIAEEKSVSNEHPLFSILTVLKQNSWFSVNSKRFAKEKTNRLLELHGITWPSEKKLRSVYARYFKMKCDENRANL